MASTIANRPATAIPTSTALATIPRTRQDEDRDRRDRDDRDEVDDALDDDRPERRRAGDPLAVAGVVAPDQLAEPGREDVVREVADEQVRQRVRYGTGAIGARRRCQRRARTPRSTHRKPTEDGDPAPIGGPEDARRSAARSTDRRTSQSATSEIADADDGADAGSPGAPRQAAGGSVSGGRAVSFGLRRTPSRWST